MGKGIPARGNKYKGPKGGSSEFGLSGGDRARAREKAGEGGEDAIMQGLLGQGSRLDFLLRQWEDIGRFFFNNLWQK